MRLSKPQTNTILQTVANWAGTNASVYLFGSRLNDQAKGGDIDLFIETHSALSLLLRAQIKMELAVKLGLPVDIVSKAHHSDASAFQMIARSHATLLEA